MVTSGTARLTVSSSAITASEPLTLLAGSAASPSILFSGSTQTGLEAATANQLALVASGTAQLTVSSSGITANQAVTVPAGTAAAPSINFSGSTTTGLEAATANQLALVASGAAQMTVSNSAITANQAITVPAGTAAAPSINFSGSTTTGLEAATANQLALVTSGAARLTVNNTAATLAVPTIFSNVLCLQGLQSVVPTGGGSVTVNSGVNVLILKNTASVSGYTIYLPPSPTQGQLFTVIEGYNASISSITFSGGTGGASVVTPTNSLTYNGTQAITFLHKCFQ